MTIVNQNTVWRAGEVINLTSNIEVAHGSTLTIEAGTVIIGNGYQIQSYGTVRANGTALNPVTFKSVSFTFSAQYSEPGRLEVSHALFSAGSFLPATGNGSYGSFAVSDSTFENVAGFYLWYPAADSSLTRNVFNGSHGFSVGVNGPKLNISENLFFNTVKNQYETDSAAIVNWANYSDSIIVEHNTFDNVNFAAMALASNYTNTSITARENYYGTSDQAKIAELILDRNDSLSRASFINISDSLTTSYVGTPTHVVGTPGVDVMSGTAGADLLYGLAGDDSYVVNHFGDRVQDSGGYDSVDTLISFSTIGTGIEVVRLAGVDNLNASGSGANEVLVGNDGANVISGLGGDDTLNGAGGADALNGGAGNDRIDGGAGIDTAIFSQTLTASTIGYSKGSLTISGADGNDSIFNIETLKFADGQVRLSGDSMVDALYYNQKNADVYSYGIEASEHYEAFGAREGRDPNAFFSSKGYLAANKDVAAAGMNPLDHYRNFGWQEGRDPSAVFDTRLYLLNNKDVADAGINPIEHYLNYGRYEARAIYAAVGKTIMANGFDAEYYLLSNPDVAAAGTDPWQHYQLYGAKEGRDPNAYFDTSAYLETNKDVAVAGINPLDHYINYGLREGRDPSAAFDTKAYLAANPDIAGSGLNPFVHFLQYGVYEGRSPQGDNNVSGPRALAEAFESDTGVDVALDIGFAHYGNAGHDRGLYEHLAIA